MAKLTLTIKEPKTVEVEVDFPIYRQHDTDHTETFSRIDEDRRSWHITRRHYDNGWEFEVESPYHFDSSDPDFHLGRGMYASSEGQFYAALRKLKAAIEDVPGPVDTDETA